MEHICTICNKNYSSYKSKWLHVKKYHTPEINQISAFTSAKYQHTENEDTYKCKYCPKKYKHIQSRWKHEQKCSENSKIIKLIDEIKKENKELKKIVNKLSNKPLINNLTFNGNINTGVVNNINALGYENIQKKLSEKEKINLITGMRVKEHPIIELVRKIYTDDKFKEDRNTLITNLRAKDCLVYNSDTNKFDATTKNDHIDNIIENRKHNIVSIYNELSANNKLRPVEIKAIDIYLNEIEDLGKKNPKVKELYEKHKAEIIYIIYNSKEFMSMLKNNLEDTIEL